MPHVKLSAKEIFDASQPLSAKISGSWQKISAGMEGEKPPCQASGQISPSGADPFADPARWQKLPVHLESGTFLRETESRFCLLEDERKDFCRASALTPPCCFFKRRSFASFAFMARPSVSLQGLAACLANVRSRASASPDGSRPCVVSALEPIESGSIPAFNSLSKGVCGASLTRLCLPTSSFVQPTGFFVAVQSFLFRQTCSHNADSAFRSSSVS